MSRRNFMRKNLGAAAAAAASSLPRVAVQGAETPGQPVKAGFAKIDISPCIKSNTKFRRPLEAICAAIGNKDSQVFIVALDLLEMPPQECLSIQEGIGRQLKIPPERILIHTTHTHCAPWGERETGQQIVNLPETLAKCISQAQANARPARIRAGTKDVGKKLSIYRRGDAGADLGFQTFWFGYTFRQGDERPDASALAAEMKSRWLRKTPDYTPGPEPIWFDGEVDSLVQTIRFEDSNGGAIGSIVRFSAHPHLTCSCKEWLYDPDYPGVVRDEMEKRTGAPTMFLSGTCCNLVPKENVKYVIDTDKLTKFPYMGPSSAFDPADDEELFAEMRRIGKAIADAALQGLDNSKTEDITSFNFAGRQSSVALNPDIPKSSEQLERLKAPLVAEYEAALREDNPLPKLRVLADKLNRLEWAPSLAKQMLTEEDRNAGRIMLPIAALALNSNILVFMHSEIPAETTFELRKANPGRNILTLGLTGGCIGYFPTAKMIEQGGYEGCATVITKDAEQELRRDVAELLRTINVA